MTAFYFAKCTSHWPYLTKVKSTHLKTNWLIQQESLLEHVSSIDERTSSVIVTQLCLALADLILVMPDWPHAVDELIQVRLIFWGVWERPHNTFVALKYSIIYFSWLEEKAFCQQMSYFATDGSSTNFLPSGILHRRFLTVQFKSTLPFIAGHQPWPKDTI